MLTYADAGERGDIDSRGHNGCSEMVGSKVRFNEKTRPKEIALRE
jgi:hypothetical protein